MRLENGTANLVEGRGSTARLRLLITKLGGRQRSRIVTGGAAVVGTL